MIVQHERIYAKSNKVNGWSQETAYHDILISVDEFGLSLMPLPTVFGPIKLAVTAITAWNNTLPNESNTNQKIDPD